MIPPGGPSGALLFQAEEPSCWPWALPSPVKPVLQVSFRSLSEHQRSSSNGSSLKFELNWLFFEQGLHWAGSEENWRGRLRCPDFKHRRHWWWVKYQWSNAVPSTMFSICIVLFVTQKAPAMNIFSPRHVWHSSPEDVCSLRQHCGWGITGLAATGDF